jgi:hypothetical protein
MYKESGLAAVHAAANSPSTAETATAKPAETASSSAALPATAATEKPAANAAANERARAKTIIGSDAAKGREELAQYFAFDTEMSAEQAIAALERAPKAEAKPASRLDRAMEGYQPKVDTVEGGTEQASRVAGLNAAVTRELKKIGKQPKQPLN